MSVSDLSPSAQNYLKTVWSLSEWSDEPVTTSSIARALGLRQSTVSDGVRRLAEQGLLAHARYGAVSLTETGRRAAVLMVRRHRLIESFLVTTLGYRWDQVHAEAEELEHAVSDFMVARIDELLGHPTRDPHGDPIPAPDGTTGELAATQLTEKHAGQQVTVERISDADGALLQFFESARIQVGSELAIQAGPPFTDSVIASTASGQQAPLGPSAMAALYVSIPGGSAAQ